MPKLKVLSGKSIIRMLSIFGFVIVRTKGSHVRMKYESCSLTVPMHEDLAKKTILTIYAQASTVISKKELDEMFYTK